MDEALTPGALAGKKALVTGSSRGVGAQTALYLAAAGAEVAINYRSREQRAQKILEEITAAGGKAQLLPADLTADQAAIDLFLKEKFAQLDLLVLNASGGMEAEMPADYAMRLNRDAQVNTLETCLPYMPAGSRVIFVTSHQAHFVRQTPTLPEYEPVALSKRAGEDELLSRVPALKEKGIELVVVSGDMIEGTVTATLINRLYPGALQERKDTVGKLYNVAEFAAEIARAAVEQVPADNLRLLGDISSFTKG